MSDDTLRTPVAVIGAGFSGLAAAIRLSQAGVDFIVLERASRVGGTWRDARYPGAEVDVPSVLYSLSFAPNPDWTRVNCRAPEIQCYLEDLVTRFGLGDRLRFGSKVIRLDFDERSGTWRVEAEGGAVVVARAVVAADGLLSEPAFPDIPGIDDFLGITLHSARWRDCDVADARVGLIGTGASAIQIVPELLEAGARLTVFQRTPSWILPRSGRAIPPVLRRVFRRLPAVQRAVRTALFLGYEAGAYALVWRTPLTGLLELIARRHLRRQVPDPELRARLTPSYRIGCNRPLLSSTFYPALQRGNCRLVPHAAVRVDRAGVRAGDGSEHPLDILVFATGYNVHQRGRAFPIVGRGGRALSDVWADGMKGYKSVSVSGFPNLFFTMGPNSFGHSSELLFIEAQVDYAVRCVREIIRRDLRVLDVAATAQDRHTAAVQRDMGRTTFASGCHSWYLSPGGYNGLMFPGTVTAYRRQLSRFRRQDYLMIDGFSSSTATRGGMAASTVVKTEGVNK